MSDAHNEHESLIKTPKQLIAVVAAAFIVPILVIVLLTKFVASDKGGEAGLSADQIAEATAARIRPVGDAGFTLTDASAPRQLLSGDGVYKATCATCHDSGLAGAPKTGDAGAWSARIAQGYDKLLANAVNGIRGMPAKGGNPDLADVEVARAVVFMANKSGASFKEPEVKDAPATAAAAPAAATTTEPAAAPVGTPAPAVPPATPPAAAAVSADTGKKIYDTACMACHAAGVAGAPKLGDKAAWAPRLNKGVDVLYTSALKGLNAMPPKGGSTASDDEIKAAVDYMLATVK